MMEALREYVLGIVTAALICGILSGLVHEGAAAGLMKFLCGMFLTVAVLSPAAELDMDVLFIQSLYDNDLLLESVAAGEEMARQARSEIIKQQTQAYILDKAEALGAQITAEVQLSEDGQAVPVGVILTGDVSPWIRSRLEELLSSDLGIQKEDQQWIG